MVGPQSLDRIGHGPRLERPICLVGSGDQFESGLAHLMRPGPPGPIGVHREIAGDREQPRPGRPVRDRIRVHPCSQQGLLHDVLRTLPVPAGQMQRITQQWPSVFGVERAYQHLVRGCAARSTSACPIWPCHVPLTSLAANLVQVVPRIFRRFVPCTARLRVPRSHAGGRPATTRASRSNPRSGTPPAHARSNPRQPPLQAPTRSKARRMCLRGRFLGLTSIPAHTALLDYTACT